MAGWRATLALGGLGGLLTALLLLLIPESPRWLERTGRADLARRAAARFARSRVVFSAGAVPHASATSAPQPASDGNFAGRLALLMALQLIQQVAFIGFFALGGIVLGKKGFSVREALLFVGLAGLGSPVGHLIAAAFIDKISRPMTLIGSSLVLAALGLVFAYAQAPPVVLAAQVGFVLVGSIMLSTLAIYAPEMFTTRSRGLANGLGYSANRVGAVMAPLVLLPLLNTSGPLVLFYVISTGLILQAVLVHLFGPRGTGGRTLD
jgi:putative MFS transporter